VLSRVVRWCQDGEEHRIEYEADPRQAERLLAECGLEGANPLGTPGVRDSAKEVEEEKPLDQKLHTAFRGAAARGNYLSTDRLDCQFACKEVCRWMSSPGERSWLALKRLCRYLAGLPRLVYVYRSQKVDTLDVYTDTDWAGCPRTRKSTSGGCLLLGSHTIKHWSSTQASISLSSGEAEFNGVVRGSGQALGYQSLLKDLGIDVPIRVWTDSSAAIGICSRQGLGKLRHLDTHTLWIQQAVRSKRIALKKVRGDQNPADLFTKHSLTRDKLQALVSLFDCHFREGRPDAAPLLRTSKGKTTFAQIRGDAGIQEDQLHGCDANEWSLNILDPEHDSEGGRPEMPHLIYDAETLENLFPSLKAPEDLETNYQEEDAMDAVYQRGLFEAQQIQASAQVLGRQARPREREATDVTKEVENVEGMGEKLREQKPPLKMARTTTVASRRSTTRTAATQRSRVSATSRSR
jgi:hypothetical protein